ELGFSFTTAQIKGEAVREGILKQNEAMTPGIKAQAMFGLLMQQLGFYQEKAALHAGDLSNKQFQLDAQWTNAKTTLGQGLTPALTHLVSAMIRGLRVTGDVVHALRGFKNTVVAVGLASIA